MTLRHMKIYVSVYQNMSITKAAQKLHLAQPSVSLAIKELEEAYHIQLFERINKRISVTEKGIQFFNYAKHIVELFDEMEHSMVSDSYQGSIRVGSSITIGNYLVPDVMAKFKEKYNECQVKVSVRNSQQIIQAVIKNELELGLIEDAINDSRLVQLPICNDQLYFICRYDHPLQQKTTITMEDIITYPFYVREQGSASREIADSVFKEFQVTPNITMESISNQALIHMVEKTDGITVLSGHLIQEMEKRNTVIKLPIHPKAFERSFSIIYHNQKYMTETMKYLIELFQQQS